MPRDWLLNNFYPLWVVMLIYTPFFFNHKILKTKIPPTLSSPSSFLLNKSLESYSAPSWATMVIGRCRNLVHLSLLSQAVLSLHSHYSPPASPQPLTLALSQRHYLRALPPPPLMRHSLRANLVDLAELLLASVLTLLASPSTPTRASGLDPSCARR